MAHGKILAFALSAILLLQVVSFGGSSNFIPQAQAVDWRTYEDPLNGFKIEYLSNWQREGSGGSTTFFVEEIGSEDDIPPSFSITIVPLYEKTSLAKLVSGVINFLTVLFEDFVVIEEIESGKEER